MLGSHVMNLMHAFGGEPKWSFSSADVGEPEPLSGDDHTGNVVACRDLADATEQDGLPEGNIHEGRMTVEMIASAFEPHRAGGLVKIPSEAS